MENKLEKITEILETREAILVKHIDLDKQYINDVINGQHTRDRIAVQEHWLEEVRKMFEILAQ